MNVLFTCGGTAGHINPALALARLFRERDGAQVLFVGADGGMEERLVPQGGFPLKTVTITNFQRSLTPKAVGHNVRTLVNMALSDTQARRILKEFQPDLVVGTGGYASYPVVKAAAKLGIPTAVHESNAVPGLTTKALSRVCDVVMVGFAESRNAYEKPEKVVLTGTPVRGDFFRYTRTEAREKLGLVGDRPLLVSFWGSLGARRMNEMMGEVLALECEQGAPFYHIHGAGRDYEAVRADFAARPEVRALGSGDPEALERIRVLDYIDDMPLVMAAADLVICRSGASTISELAAIAKPAILVPSPNVTADHQTKNAKVLSQVGGAVLLPEQDCSGKVLYQTATDLLHDPVRRSEMARSLTALAISDANEKIYTVLKGLMEGR